MLSLLLIIMLFALIGAFAGIAAGLFGIGGGSIIVPGIFLVLSSNNHSESMHYAIATSLLVMIFTAASSAYANNRNHNVRWDIFRKMLPGIIIGVFAGALVSVYLSGRVLAIIFGIVLLFISYKLFFGFNPHREKEKDSLLSIFSPIIGFKSGLLGVGGGTVSVPLFSYYGLEMNKATGTSSSLTLPIAISGTIAHFIFGAFLNQGASASFNVLGSIFLPAALALIPFTMVFALLGARLSKVMPQKYLRIAFSLLLFAVSIKLIFF